MKYLIITMLVTSILLNCGRRVIQRTETFIQEGTKNTIILNENGEAKFYWESLDDSLCGVGKLDCKFTFRILEDGRIYLMVPSAWIKYYSSMGYDSDGNIFWNQFDPSKK